MINTIIDTIITSMANNSTPHKETPIIVPTETLVESQFRSIFNYVFVLLLLIASGFDITQLCMYPTIISDSTMLVLNTLALYTTFLDVPSAQRKCSCVMWPSV